MEDNSLAGRRARRYLDDWRFQKPRITGYDLIRLGVPRGPQLGAVLTALRSGRLDGKLMSKDEERTFVQSWLRGRSRRRQ
jgi:tRNA nucleotidyltransferase (CCA-adding enzyme)